jgi:hypothetical protein
MDTAGMVIREDCEILVECIGGVHGFPFRGSRLDWSKHSRLGSPAQGFSGDFFLS